MNKKKLFALILAAMMLLSLCACGKDKDNTITDALRKEQQAVSEAAGTLLLQAGMELTLAYDKEGTVTAIISATDAAEAVDDAYLDFEGKTCDQVVLELTELIAERFGSDLMGFILVRQEPGSVTPSDDFIKTIRTTAAGNNAKIPVIVIAADDLDEEGCFGTDVAEQIMDAYLGGAEDLTVKYDLGLIPYYHHATCTDANGNTTAYLIDAVNGRVESYHENTEPSQEELDSTEEFSDFTEDPVPDYELAGEDMPQADLSDYT